MEMEMSSFLVHVVRCTYIVMMSIVSCLITRPEAALGLAGNNGFLLLRRQPGFVAAPLSCTHCHTAHTTFWRSPMTVIHALKRRDRNYPRFSMANPPEVDFLMRLLDVL
jgi:hypothetical protein